MDREDLAILGRINDSIGDLKKRFAKQAPVVISDYLDENLVSFLEVDNQTNALATLVNTLSEQGKLRDKEAFFHAILEREKIVSTGIGIGVAIPHAKSSGYEDFFIAIGIQKGEGIEWKALDGLPVRLIFMIGGPEDRQTEYLNILSMITAAIKDGERLKSLTNAKNEQEVIAIFKGL